MNDLDRADLRSDLRQIELVRRARGDGGGAPEYVFGEAYRELFDIVAWRVTETEDLPALGAAYWIGRFLQTCRPRRARRAIAAAS